MIGHTNKQRLLLYIYRYYLRRSQYCRRISNSFRTLASRLQCLSVGCACTILWRQRAARARTCREGRGRFGLRWSRCRSWTRRGIHLLDLIISQLVGLEDIASRVLDIFSTSVHPAVQYSLNKYIVQYSTASTSMHIYRQYSTVQSVKIKQVSSSVKNSVYTYTDTMQYSTVWTSIPYSTVSRSIHIYRHAAVHYSLTSIHINRTLQYSTV